MILIKDVLDLRSSNNTPFYNLGLNSNNSSRIHSGNSTYLKATHLPPLDLTKTLSKSLKASRKLKRGAANQCSKSLSFDSSADLPDTDNKKKSPKNIVPVVPGFALERNICQTPLTIDILSESGRDSRFSVGQARLSFSRPGSNRDSCYYHPEKLRSLRNSVDLSNYPTLTIVEEVPKAKDSNSKLDPIKESKMECKGKAAATASNLTKSKTVGSNLSLSSSRINLVSKPVTPQSKPQSNCMSNFNNNNNNKLLTTAAGSALKPVSSVSKLKPTPTKMDSSRLVADNKTASGRKPASNLSPVRQNPSVAKKISPTETDKAKAYSQTNLEQPGQPLIYTMFEGFPHPFTSRSNVSDTKSGSSIGPKGSTKSSATSSRKIPFYTKKPKTASKTKGEAKSKTKTKKTKPGTILVTAENLNLDKSLVIDYKSYEAEEFEQDSGDESSSSSSSSSSTLFAAETNNNLTAIQEPNGGSTNELNNNNSNEMAEKLATSISLENLDQVTSSSPSQPPKKRNSITAKDFIHSFEEKFFAIYNKFDQLLNQQESNLEKSSASFKMRELNEQKTQFIDETAKELNENVDLNTISSDPELLLKLKNIYDVIQSSKDKNNDKGADQNKKTNSLDIREIYSLVNTAGRTSSLGSNSKPTKSESDDEKKDTESKTIYHIPPSLTNKISTMLTLAAMQQNNGEPVSILRRHSSKNDSLNKSKHNSDEEDEKTDDNEATISDTNSISYHYDFKFRDQSPINYLSNTEFRWKRGHQIGKGAFGSVYQAMLSTGEIIAVKQIEMEDSDPLNARKEYESVREEVNILRQLKHDNIVQFMGTMLEGNVVNIFMELIPGGTIDTLLKTYGPFEEDLFRTFATQILMGVNYIHSKGVVHRDIKGKNIMLMSSGIIKLIDFGCAKRLKKNQSSNSIKQLFKSIKGTPYWMSPEVIKGTGHGSKADIWSTGATIFEMATGLPPWGELSPISAIYAIGSGEAAPPQLPDKFSPECRDLVRACLTRDPDLRPSAAQLLAHSFIAR